MKTLRKFLSVILVLILCPLIIGQIAAASARSFLRDSTYIKESLREAGLYSRVQFLLIDQLSEGVGESQFAFTPDETGRIVTGLLPASRLELLAETAIDGFHTWFWSGAERPEIVLDLSEMRQEFPAVIKPIIIAKLEALPVCSAAEAADLANSYKGGMPPCKSPNADFNRKVIDQTASDAQLARLIPERVDLTGSLGRANGPDYWRETAASFEEARATLNLIPFGWVVIALLMGLLALLNLDRWYTPLGWIATPMLISGSLLFVISVIAVPLFRTTIGPSGAAMEELGPPILTAILTNLFSLIRGISLITVLVGLGAVIAAVVCNRYALANSDPNSSVA